MQPSKVVDDVLLTPHGAGLKIPQASFTTLFQGCSVEFSPFTPRLIAVATAQYFGIIGNGRQYFLEVGDDGSLREIRNFLTQEGLYDCSWSEVHERQLVSASADGSIKLWDMSTSDDFPIAQWHEHREEASSVDWNLVAKTTFLSASWDATIRLYDPVRPQSLAAFVDHTACVYNAIWSPREPHRFVSCSGDGTVRVWDATAGQRSVQTIAGHEGEVLGVDWDKYAEWVVYSGGVDRVVRSWDLRRPSHPVASMEGHGYPVRRLKSSPHHMGVLGSVSYDMTFRLWDCKASSQHSPGRPIGPAPSQQLAICDFHSEFTTGLDFNLFIPGQVVRVIK